jgi:uncharacterized protein (TIGR03437 family)
MNPIVVLICLSPAIALAQFSELSTTLDGRHLYFTSAVNFRGAPADRGEQRIFRVTETGSIEFFAERPPVLAPTFSFGSGDGARSAQVSADGQSVIYTLQGICEDPANCTSNSGSRAEIRGRYAQTLGSGTAYLSQNGRWALLVPPGGFGPGHPAPPPDATLFNLGTGEQTLVPQPPFVIARPLASDGSVLTASKENGAYGIWRAGSFRPLSVSGLIAPWAISDDAGYVLMRSGMGRSLTLLNVVSGVERVVITTSTPDEFPWPMGMSSDGHVVLYRVVHQSLDGPAYVANTATGQTVELAYPGRSLATDGTLSGSGNAAFLVITAGAILRFDLTHPGLPPPAVVPATPFVQNLHPSPGTFTRLQGSMTYFYPDLAGRILLDGRPLPVLGLGAYGVEAQIPWETRSPAEVPFTLDIPGQTPFQQNHLTLVSPMSPAFEPLDPGQTSAVGFKAIRDDWSGLLTEDPKPGEVFHAYMTGLGPVQGEIATGQPTPPQPLYPIVNPFTCRFFPYTAAAETLFAGLAPGFTGMYQVTFRMPEQSTAPGPITGGTCEWSSGSGGGGFSWSHLPMASPAAR